MSSCWPGRQRPGCSGWWCTAARALTPCPTCLPLACPRCCARWPTCQASRCVCVGARARLAACLHVCVQARYGAHVARPWDLLCKALTLSSLDQGPQNKHCPHAQPPLSHCRPHPLTTPPTPILAAEPLCAALEAGRQLQLQPLRPPAASRRLDPWKQAHALRPRPRPDGRDLPHAGAAAVAGHHDARAAGRHADGGRAPSPALPNVVGPHPRPAPNLAGAFGPTPVPSAPAYTP